MVFFDQLFQTDVLPYHFIHQLPSLLQVLKELSFLTLQMCCVLSLDLRRCRLLVKHQVVKALKLDLILVLHSDPQGAQDVECVVDPTLHIFEIQFETARLHDFRRNVSACGHLVLLYFF